MTIVLAVCGTSAVIAAMIAYSRTQQTAAFVGFFFFGAFLPLIGIVAACLVKPAAQAGWYGDPWQQAPLRWHDGQQWTGHTA